MEIHLITNAGRIWSLSCELRGLYFSLQRCRVPVPALKSDFASCAKIAAPVAQLVRHRFCGREDPGSIPGAARLPDWHPQLCHWGVGWAPALHRSPEEEQEPSHKWEKHIPCGGRGINK